MDIISFTEASTANGRIQNIINDPDSTSGVITVPKVIASGETITIPAGRMAVLPNVQVDGTLNVQGDVFIPSGATLSGVVEKVTSTDNAVVRFNGTNGDVQNSGVTIDDNGNLGLGTSTPSNNISSYKASGGWSTGIGVHSGGRFIQMSADSNVGTDIFWNNTSPLRFSTGSASDATGYTERMRIDTNGNLGIGTTPSSWGSSIKAQDIGLGTAVANMGSYVSSAFAANCYYNGGWKYKNNEVASLYEQQGTHKWYIAPSGTAGNAVPFTTAMSLSQSGHLLLGNTSSTTAVLNIVDQDAIGNNSWAMAFQMKQSSSNGYPMLFLNSSGTTVGSIQTTATGTSYGVSSDYRLKEDWKPMENSISRLMELKPCNFKWKETGHRVDGFIAHEVQEVVPEAATGVKDEMMEEEYEISPVVEATYDEEGNELTPRVEAVIGKRQVPKYQGIDQSKLVPLLTSALQDAVLKIESLERRIEILEGAK